MGNYGVEEIDRGWNDILQQLNYLEQNAVDIGLQAGESNEDGMDMAYLGAVHEFGATINVPARKVTTYHKVKKNGDMKKGFAKKKAANFAMDHDADAYTITIPSRPFMRNTFDKKQGEIDSFMQRLIKNIYSRQIAADTALKLIGEKYESMIKQNLRDGNWEPNAPSTIRKKKSSRPLIDLGRLRNTIRYVVKRRQS